MENNKQKEKRKEYNRQYRIKKGEELKEKKRIWSQSEAGRASARKSYEKNKEKRLAETKKYYQKNKEKLLAYSREYNKKWYAEHREERAKQIREYSKNHKKDNVRRTQKYVVNNKEKVDEYNREFNQTVEGKYRMLIYRAKHYAGTPITFDEFKALDSSPCVYCGFDGKVGIDRVDNANGYTKENTASACKLCNFMKKAMSVEDFINHITKIYLHNEKTSR